jgi:hypothetical protein
MPKPANISDIVKNHKRPVVFFHKVKAQHSFLAGSACRILGIFNKLP